RLLGAQVADVERDELVVRIAVGAHRRQVAVENAPVRADEQDDVARAFGDQPAGPHGGAHCIRARRYTVRSPKGGTMRLTVAAALCGAFAASPAHAFCGFFVAGTDARLYNNASQVVLLRDGNRTAMTMSNNYQGPPENFAMVVPVPVVLHKEDVKTLAHDVFEHIDSLSAPRLVEYWEQDPCWIPPPEEKGGRVYSAEAPSGRPTDDGALGVKVEARFVVGEYEIVILSANDSSGLDKWLRLNKYTIPAGAAEALAPYVRQQMKFFVAKVDIKKVQRDAQGVVQLSPLRFSFESNELRLPVRLGLLNAQDKQDLIVYVLSPTSRFEAANYPNAFVPTNIDVADEV